MRDAVALRERRRDRRSVRHDFVHAGIALVRSMTVVGSTSIVAGDPVAPANGAEASR
jgi:hypothetical protein